jgi:hypothetical protein
MSSIKIANFYYNFLSYHILDLKFAHDTFAIPI